MSKPPNMRYQHGWFNRLKAKLLGTSLTTGAVLVGIYDTGAYFAAGTVETIEAALQAIGISLPTHVIADPGAAGAIPVTKSGSVMLTSAGAETRTIAIPTFKGQRLSVSCDTYVGDITLTATQPVNQTGNNTMVFGAARDNLVFLAITVGGALRWQVIANDGVLLSTV